MAGGGCVWSVQDVCSQASTRNILRSHRLLVGLNGRRDAFRRNTVVCVETPPIGGACFSRKHNIIIYFFAASSTQNTFVWPPLLLRASLRHNKDAPTASQSLRVSLGYYYLDIYPALGVGAKFECITAICYIIVSAEIISRRFGDDFVGQIKNNVSKTANRII